MKLATAIVAIAAASFALVAADAPCDAKLTTTLTGAASVIAKCKSDSGFDITATAASSDTLTKFCKSESCRSMWKTVKALGLSECMIYDKHLNKEILNPLAAACPELGSAAAEEDSSDEDSHDMAAMNSTTPAAATTKAPSSSSNSTTPASTTKAPTASNSTSSGNSTTAKASNSTSSNSTSSNSTKTPAPTTKAPTPSTSGASALSLTAGAVVLTVATAFF